MRLIWYPAAVPMLYPLGSKSPVKALALLLTAGASMPAFRHGLCKLGDYYHYHFKVLGIQFHGSTRATDQATAKKVLIEKRREAVLKIQTG